MTPRRAALALPRLVVHKGMHRARRWVDEHGGWRRAASRAEAWGQRWLEASDGIVGWLDRPGGGRLWVDHHVGPRWARRSSTPGDVGQADEILAGRIPRLGADPITGHPPAWLRDGYTGRDWPVAPASRLPLMRGDGSDIRTVWELSRCYHFVTLARAWARTGDGRYPEAFRSHVESWLVTNPPGLGPNWVSPMDAAIRAANWALATVLLARAPGLSARFWATVLANLRLTARYLERNLEWHPLYRGNHYISNAVGLTYVGALFRDDPEGGRWLRAGTRILEQEVRYQVHPDGASFEGSTGYHRLVTEFFAWGAEVGRRNLARFPSREYLARLEGMYRFLETGLDGAGRAPLMGDADDGRLHHLCPAARDHPRMHRLGLPPRYRSVGVPESQAFPQGGWYVLRTGQDRCIVRCGPVGLAGAGSHDHNDQLSFELVLDGSEVITDSGTYAYGRDLDARLAFRATAAHNVVQIGGEEQNPVRVDRPWRVLADRTRSECLHWETGTGGAVFEGRHSGFAHRPSGAICSRRITLDAASGRWEFRDTITGQGREEIAWRLHLAPGKAAVAERASGRWQVRHGAAPDRRMELAAPSGLVARLGESSWSERYGTAVLRPMILLSGTVELPAEITFSIAAPGDPAARLSRMTRKEAP